MRGKLIVIDGLDGSGKSTQAQLLWERLKGLPGGAELISYPDYEKPSSTLVRMYLSGAFSENADDVNAYAASTFYAADRYAGFMHHWGALYRQGKTILASRYVSSNAIHQMVKLPRAEWDAFLAWLEDYEYEKLELPRPDLVLFLDMPRTVADRLILSRYGGDESKKDIHEKNRAYLEKCEQSARYAAQKKGWRVIPCSDGTNPLPIDTIAEQIWMAVSTVL